jgi:flagellar hook-associated protein 1 FlgK
MGTGALTSLGMRAMAASYAQLQTTSSNIANVNTKGYSRQEVQLATAGGQFTGAGFFGRGVDIASVTRAHEDFLTREASLSTALAAADSARSEQLLRLEKVFGTGEAGLGFATNQMFNAFADVASKPQDMSSRQVVLERAGELAKRFAIAGEQIDELQGGVTVELKTAVSQVNDLTKQIALLNQKISNYSDTGKPPNDMLDQRDQAIQDLSKLVQVTTIGADDGSLSVFMGAGQALVLGSQTTSLVAMPDPYDASRVGVGLSTAGGDQSLPTSLLTGGSIAGLVRFQSTDITDARNLLGQMALAVGLQTNEQQSRGIDLYGQTGAGMFRFGSASGLPVVAASGSSFNSGSASVALTMQAPSTLSALGVSSVQPNDYRLTADGAGGFELARLKDGELDTSYTPVSVVNGDVIDGFKIAISGAASAGDTFLLRPCGTAALNMRLDMSNPKLIAAASPLSGTLGPANAGTGAIGALTYDSTDVSANANLPVTLKFQTTIVPGQYTYTWTNAGGTTTVPNVWSPGQPIPYSGAAPSDSFSVLITGAPVAADASSTPAVTSDTFVFGANSYTSSDNTNAKALLGLRDTAFVGAIWNAGTLEPGASVTDAFASIIANIGVRVQSTTNAATLSADVAAEAEKARSSKAGVNLDEEAARLIQYQQSYQAAAKMLQVAQSVFDTLLQTAGR